MTNPSVKSQPRALIPNGEVTPIGTTIQLDVLPPPATPVANGEVCVALIGNPNAGKTTLFNALTGLRAKTANFPGTTIERRSARIAMGGQRVELVDLPGLYTLAAATSEERIARDALLGAIPGQAAPKAVILILDATNLERNLFLASQVLELNVPVVVALNMVDLARRAGIRVDAQALERELGCPVLPIVARTGQGVEDLRSAVERAIAHHGTIRKPESLTQACACAGCPFEARYNWAESIGSRCAATPPMTHGRSTEKVDRVLTHPFVGVVAFFSVMFVVFLMIFWIAQYPMDGIDWLFTTVGSWSSQAVTALANAAPEGSLRVFVDQDLRSLMVGGIIGGVGGTLVFLPQIAILFFFISLLEDTGYLARAAFVMDRLMRRVGLPGKAFVPLLSAHACAVPAVMATRVIEDRRDRLATILIIPLMSCSARIPVYTMIAALLFRAEPLKAAVLFTSAYALGVLAALGMAYLFKKSLLKGKTKPLVLELPSYKLPSLRNALYTMIDRASVFVRKVGPVIFFGSIALWALSNYPKTDPPPEAVALQQQAETIRAQAQQLPLASEADTDAAAELDARAERLTTQHALSHSLAGRLGRTLEPLFKPLGYDWQITVGILSSFYAREVIVSTLAIVYGVGRDAADENPTSLYDTMYNAQRSDGSRVFNTATCASLLVFYVLAMQCISTLSAARRETGSWKWPAFMFAYLTALAYGAAFLTYQTLLALNVA